MRGNHFNHSLIADWTVLHTWSLLDRESLSCTVLGQRKLKLNLAYITLSDKIVLPRLQMTKRKRLLQKC
jgi:hypothetical protein